MRMFKTLQIVTVLLMPLLNAGAQIEMEDLYHLLYRFEGTESFEKYGNAVYIAGDVNGDGYGDILIGAQGKDVGYLDSAGTAYFYSGLDGELLYTFDGENDYANLGCAVSDIEDTDGDGLPEILIGAQNTEAHGMGGAGKVYHCSGVDGSVIHEYCGETYSDYFGNDLEGIGDADGDGYGDFIVGAKYFADVAPWKRGAAYVYSGQPGLLFPKLLHKYEGAFTAEEMGYKVCRMGDVNKDGRNDFAYLTLKNQTGIPPNGGRVTVRSGADGSLIKEIFGDIPQAKFSRIDYGGDVNGDGWPDLMVGQMDYMNGSLSQAGRVFIYSGKDWNRIYTYVGRNANGKLGISLATVGDINYDDYCDLIIGAHGDNDLGIGGAGAAYIHSGKDGSTLEVIYGDKAYGHLGIALHGGGDVNGDGLSDIVIGTAEDINGYKQAGSALVYTAKSLQASDTVPLGGSLEMNLHVPAHPFGAFYLAFSLGMETGIPVGTRILPLNWDILFTATIGNPVLTGNLDAEGKKHISLPIANDPTLSGLTFYAAFFTLEKGKPMGVRTISNPEEIEIL